MLVLFPIIVSFEGFRHEGKHVEAEDGVERGVTTRGRLQSLDRRDGRDTCDAAHVYVSHVYVTLR